ncbi:hypothetical protein Mapa_004963 [Marchantia paleacea]|nr:hypothetical protein Mapa_004963 [Marchantia paleacea]
MSRGEKICSHLRVRDLERLRRGRQWVRSSRQGQVQPRERWRESLQGEKKRGQRWERSRGQSLELPLGQPRVLRRGRQPVLRWERPLEL